MLNRKLRPLRRWLSRYRLAVFHLTGWVIYILYEYLTIFFTTDVRLDAVTIYFYGCNISLFYAHLWVLETCISGPSRPRYLKAAAGMAAALLVIMLLKFLGEYIWVLPRLPRHPDPRALRYMISSDFFRCLTFAGLSTLYWAASHLQDYRLAAERDRSQRLAAERDHALLESNLAEVRNAYLQQQLNPHLLFNALNFIYSSVLPHSPDAARCVYLLAELMRYSAQGAGQDGKVSLAEEVIQVQHLLEINRYRFDGQLQLSLESSGDWTAFRIIPLVLLTLTENLLKHGVLRNPEKQASLLLKVNPQGVLSFRSRNYKKPRPLHAAKPGIGLRNLSLRLAHTYPGRHRWQINEDAEIYEMTLEVTL